MASKENNCNDLGLSMTSNLNLLIVTGSLCLAMALIEACLLVGRFASEDGPVARLVPGKQDLLKSHIDYLMMAQFLFIFFLMYRSFDLAPSSYVIGATCIGSFFNPFAFLVRALRPNYLKAPPAAFTAMISVSCILTTLGYGFSAWHFAKAALG